MELKENEKLCPECGELISYCNKYKAMRSIKNNTSCKSCCRKGDKNPMFGTIGYFKDKKLSDEHRQKIKDNHADVSGDKNPMFGKVSVNKGKKSSDEVRQKISNVLKGKKRNAESIENIRQSQLKYYETHVSQSLGRKFSEETKTKMRLAAIKRISECKINGNQFYPSYNKKSIPIIENYASINNLKINHAENGGEYFIKELGYWVDGYDINNNIVIEFNEKYHKYMIEKDTQRRTNIINFLKCDFIIIDEDLTITIIKYVI